MNQNKTKLNFVVEDFISFLFLHCFVSPLEWLVSGFYLKTDVIIMIMMMVVAGMAFGDGKWERERKFLSSIFFSFWIKFIDK